jgi:uncharacterized protein
MTVTTAAPGWYPDPWHQASWRWWDGAAWTAYTEQWFGAASPAPVPGQIRAGGIAALGFIVGMGVATVIGIALTLVGFGLTDPAVLLGTSLGLWFGLGGSCVVAVKRKGTGSLKDLGLVPPRWVDLALGAGFAVAVTIAVAIVTAVLSGIDSHLLPDDRTDITNPIHNGAVLGIVVLYFVAVVGAPFFEELFFRGLVQGTLTARWGVRIAIVVQALLFGLVHLDPANGWGNIGVFAIITTVGCALGLIRHYSGRLPPGMFTHAGYNAIILTIAVVGK